MKRLEKFLDNFDYFQGKSILDRHKLRFHADYLKARAIYYDNIMVFPDLHKVHQNHMGSSNEPEAGSEESKEVQTSAASS